MRSRDDILARVRANQPAAVALPSVPTFDPVPDDPLGKFKTGLVRMGGRFIEPNDIGDIATLVARRFPDASIVCSAAHEIVGNRDLAAVRNAADLHDVDVAVVRALFGVAETGSVWLDDRALGVNALGFLAQHLVVLLDPAAIVPNLHHAYRDRARFDVRYGIFMTGPSATADIEGVLIHGAQGVRSLTVVPLAAG